ncbi:MAG: hypothetical protein ACR2GD_04125 [Pyrinomonadaceae bacterium]
MTWNDEIVEEVREIRDKYAAKFDYDISAICADIRRKQKKSGRKIVSLARDEKEAGESDLLKAA